jgi:hypothetical protein
MSIAPEGYELTSNSRFPTSISSLGALLSERGDEGEVGKSGISSDNFSFRTLHQMLDVAHHFRQMGITGKKSPAAGRRRGLSILSQEPRARISHGMAPKKTVGVSRFGRERLPW